MPRTRLPEGERKENVRIRLKQKVIEEILKEGSLQEIIERILDEYLKKRRL